MRFVSRVEMEQDGLLRVESCSVERRVICVVSRAGIEQENEGRSLISGRDGEEVRSTSSACAPSLPLLSFDPTSLLFHPSRPSPQFSELPLVPAPSSDDEIDEKEGCTNLESEQNSVCLGPQPNRC